MGTEAAKLGLGLVQTTPPFDFKMGPILLGFGIGNGLGVLLFKGNTQISWINMDQPIWKCRKKKNMYQTYKNKDVQNQVPNSFPIFDNIKRDKDKISYDYQSPNNTMNHVWVTPILIISSH